jgi:hypothetical protein
MPATTIDELVIKLGADIDKKAGATLAKFHGQIAVVANQATQLGKQIYNAFQGIAQSIIGAADNSLSLRQLAERAGTSTDAIQAMQYAAEAAGGSITEMNRDLAFLGTGARQSGTTLEAYWNGIAEQIQNAKTLQDAIIIGQSYGLSETTARTMRPRGTTYQSTIAKGSSADALRTKEEIDIAADAAEQWKALKVVLTAAANTIQSKLLPPIIRMVKPLKDWLLANKTLIAQRLQQLFIGIAKGLEGFWSVLGNIWQTIRPVVQAVLDFTGAGDDMTDTIAALVKWGGLLLASFMALSAIASINPVMLAAALAITGIAWAIEDLTSKDSKIAKFWSDFQRDCPNATAVIEMFSKGLQGAFAIIVKVSEAIAGIIIKVGELFSILEKPPGGSLNVKPGTQLRGFHANTPGQRWAERMNNPDQTERTAYRKEQGFGTPMDWFADAKTARAIIPGAEGRTTTDNSTTTINVNGVTDPIQAANEVKRLLPMNTNAPGGFAPAAQ